MGELGRYWRNAWGGDDDCGKKNMKFCNTKCVMAELTHPFSFRAVTFSSFLFRTFSTRKEQFYCFIYAYCYLCILIVSLCYRCLCVVYVFLDAATLNEVFPCFFLSCKANARVNLAKTGHGPHSHKLLCSSMYICFVSFCVFFVCKCVLYYYHRVTTQLQLINISYHTMGHHVLQEKTN